MLKLENSKKDDSILLLGPPNVGKSTFFNRVTNSVSQVANYSGTTNQASSGKLKTTNHRLIDLPGSHSIVSSNAAEVVTNDIFLGGEFQHVIGFLSATNFKRDLFSILDYMESGMVQSLIVTQIDEQKSFHIAKRVLETLLGVHIMTIVATKLKLNSEIISRLSKFQQSNFKLDYDDRVEIAIKAIVSEINFNTHLSKRFIAIQVLSNREDIIKNIIPNDVLKKLVSVRINLSLNGKVNFENLINEKRSVFIDSIIKKTCKKTSQEVIKTYDKSFIDKLLLNKLSGILIFIFLMTALYFLSFSEWTGGFLQQKISQLLIGDEDFLGLTGSLRQELIVNPNQWFGVEMIIQGILNPIFLVFSFLPYLFIFFFLTTLMKQTGYYSRAVVLFDSMLERFGLSGHSIISLIAGLGCSIPAVIATRSIPSKKERYITAFVAPLIPCSARLSVNTILVALFFNGAYSWLIVVGITISSGLVWLLFSLSLSRTLFRKEFQWIVINIPNWRRPDVLSLIKGSWKMISEFIVRMGGYLVIAGLLIFFLSAFTTKGISNFTNNGYSDTFLFHISSNIGKIFIPAGFGDAWQSSAALISGIPAKEVVITTLASTSGSVASISNIFTPASLISFVLFSTFYTPCTPTTSILRKETKDKKWFTAIHLVSSFAFAWIVSTIIYQIMSL